MCRACCLVRGREQTKAKRRAPEVVLRSGRPAAVILDINEHQKILKRPEDLEDLKALKTMRSKPLTFKRLEDFLTECTPSVSDPS